MTMFDLQKKFPMLSKFSPKMFGAVTIGVLAVVVLFAQVISLNSNLNSTTKITQSLRDEVEKLRKENQSYEEKVRQEHSQVEGLNTQLSTLQQDKDLSVQKQEELKKLVEDAEKSLDNQNVRIKDLEQKLKEADESIRRQKKASATLEAQTKSAKSNPSVTPEYVKLVESEWLAATEKTVEMKKDLDRTLSELSGQNKEREKLRADTATMHYNLAVILTDQKNYPAAIREYQKVLETRPNDADAHYNLAIIYDDYMKDNGKAMEHYRQYIKIAPNSQESNRVRQWLKDKEFETALKFKL